MVKSPKNKKLELSKLQIVDSDLFRNDAYILSAILDDTKTYTISEVEKLLRNYKKKEV